MSSTPINSILSQAYGLIEADQLTEAVDMLRPVLAEHPGNADAWWLYAHAVSDVDDARAALQTVLQLDPQYPEAQRLLQLLEEASSGSLTAVGNPLNDVDMQPIRTIPDLPAAIPEEPMDDVDRELASFDSTERPKAGGPNWLTIGGLAALFLCFVILALLLTQSAQAPGNGTQVAQISPEDLGLTGTAIIDDATRLAGLSAEDQDATLAANNTQIFVDATANAALTLTAAGQGGGELAMTDIHLTATAIIESVTASAQSTVPVPTQEIAGGDALEPLNTAFSAALGEGNGVEMGMTSRGETLIVRVCTEIPNIELRDTLARALGVMAGQGSLLQAGLGGVGFRLQNCESGQVYRLLTASITDALAYTGGSLSAAELEARLQVE